MDRVGPFLPLLLFVLALVWQGIKALSRVAGPPPSEVDDVAEARARAAAALAAAAMRRTAPHLRRSPWDAPPPPPTPPRPTPPRPTPPPVTSQSAPPLLQPVPAARERRLPAPFGGASVREAIIASEVLGPPVALR
jgi:hypothetical protein